IRWPIKRRLQHFFHLLPSFRSHYLSLILHPSSFIVLKSHALAARQSRRTVIKEIPSTSAVSSRLRPPKYRSSTTRLLRGSIFASPSRASSRATNSAAR